MGNKKSKLSSFNFFVDKVYETSDSKSRWIDDWCKEEKNKNASDASVPPKCSVQKCFRMFCHGRTIGIPAIEKVICVISPIYTLAKEIIIFTKKKYILITQIDCCLL
jgi:hypothetical protein